MLQRSALVVVLFVGAGPAACGIVGSSRQAGEEPRTRGVAAQQSPEGRGLTANLHADESSSLDASGAASLRETWKVQTKAFLTHRPLVESGRAYFADWSGTVYAIDAKSGDELWRKEVETPNEKAPWRGFSGTGALGEGMLFEASVEGQAFALDLRTGEVRWKVRFAPDNKYAGNCGAILYHEGLVYIPVSSFEEGVVMEDKSYKPSFRGRVIALRAKDGSKAWERFLVEPPSNGVAVWGGFALDPATNTLFFGTGNNYTGDATRHSDAIMALDASSGEIRWSRQITQKDVWTMAERHGPDYDFGTAPQLFEGGGRALVGAGQKSGVYHVLDRRTGEVVWQAWAGHGEIAGGIMADASVSNGRLFVWSNNSYDPAKREAEKAPMSVRSFHLASGERLWSVLEGAPAGANSAGFLSKDVYFVGSLDGRVRGYRADDGSLLWTSPAGDGSVGASLTVAEGQLLVGRGVPKMFGGKEPGTTGLWAYSATPQAR